MLLLSHNSEEFKEFIETQWIHKIMQFKQELVKGNKSFQEAN